MIATERVFCDPADDPGTITADMAGIFYCGDNLEVLREYVPAESVDLVYLDPPFNSKRTYNLIYKGSEAQELAFKDYWSWEEASATFARFEASSDAPRKLRAMLRSLHDLLIDDDSDLLAYLAMMAPRLVALHRALKPTGSLYLHCDPTASHYLKVLLDAIFGGTNFSSEVIWKRTQAHNSAGRYGPVHDVLFYYAKGGRPTWNQMYQAYSDGYITSKFGRTDEKTGKKFGSPQS